MTMSTKELAMETIRALPEDTSWQEIEERIRFLAAIERGRAEVRRGEVIPHEEVRDLLQAWITETTRRNTRVFQGWFRFFLW